MSVVAAGLVCAPARAGGPSAPASAGVGGPSAPASAGVDGPSRPTGVASRPGVVLVAALLLMAALAIATAGLLAISAQEMAIAEAAAASLRARTAAGSAAASVVREWPAALDSIAHGQSVALEVTPVDAEDAEDGVVRASALVTRLDGPLFLVRGNASLRAPGGGERARSSAGLLLRAPDVATSRDALAAALTAPGLVDIAAAAQVTASADSSACDPASRLSSPGQFPAVQAASADSVVVSGVAMGDPSVVIGQAPPVDALVALAAAHASKAAAGTVRPRPVADEDGCRSEDALNWGDPAALNSACAEYRPVIVAPASLEIDGGVGQGVLVVKGSLRITRGAIFRGVVLVDGELVLDDGARVIGAIRARRARLLSGSVVFSGCAVEQAFAAGGLARPTPLRKRTWVPQF